jgi:hypothetical protein
LNRIAKRAKMGAAGSLANWLAMPTTNANMRICGDPFTGQRHEAGKAFGCSV